MNNARRKTAETESERPKWLQVAEFIKNGILAGKYPAGSRVTEKQICEETGASRSSVRVAFRQLTTEGYLTSIPNRGPIVSTLTAEEAVDIYQVRTVLEGLAVHNFISMATERQRRELRRALDELVAAVDRKDSPVQLRAIEEIYEILLLGCHNTTLGDMVRFLRARFARGHATSMMSPGRIRRSLRELEEIASAIEAADSARAWESTVRRIESTSAVALHMLGRMHGER